MPELATVYNSGAEVDSLTNIFVKRYGGMLAHVHGLLTRALNQGEEPLQSVSIRRAVLQARARAVRVDATTQFAIAAMLAEGTRRGLSREQIANGTEDFPGIQGLFTQTWRNRARTIAETELQNAALTASVEQFQQHPEIVAMLAHDGDYDAQCAARNGREYPMNNPPQLLHPNCRLTVTPVIAPVTRMPT